MKQLTQRDIEKQPPVPEQTMRTVRVPERTTQEAQSPEKKPERENHVPGPFLKHRLMLVDATMRETVEYG